MLTFSQRQKLIAHVTGHARNTFYRDLYKTQSADVSLDISTEEEWKALPIFTKDELIPIPMAEVSFLPLKEIDHVRASSGTSGKPPLFSPRSHVRGTEYRSEFHDFKKSVLSFGVPMMPHWHEIVQKEQGAIARSITFDPRYPYVSARLAAAAGVDAISFFVHHIKTTGEAMKKINHNKNIRFIELAGGICSRGLYEYMKEIFPNATILPFYGSSEVEDVPIGVPCRPIDGREPLSIYHPKESHYLEIVHPETVEFIKPVPGAEGDLVITSYPGEPCAFPLVRFKIGDTVRVVENDCSHSGWSFTVLGRTELDFLKIEGGVLRADEVARVLSLFRDMVTDDFEIHSHERKTKNGIRTQIEVHVEVKKRDINLDSLALEIANNLRVSPTRTYEDGVSSGVYLPLVCKEIAKSDGVKKRKRIVVNTDQ